MIRTLIIEDDFRVAEINAAYVGKDPDFETGGLDRRHQNTGHRD